MFKKIKRENIKSFNITNCFFDTENSKAVLEYSFADSYHFTEEITFVNAPKTFSKTQISAINQVLKYLHVAAGVSYYKAFIPQNIIVENTNLDEYQKDFFYNFYYKGLGEFAYKNKINLKDKINFICNLNEQIEPANNIDLKEKIAIPIGGGKDSITALEILRRSNLLLNTIAIGRPRPIKDTIETAALPDIELRRKISSTLLDINKYQQELDALNGHVPVTGVIAFILSLAAIIYNYKYIAMANERSANIGNTTTNYGLEVNHQWSKSYEFEKSFKEFNQKYMLKNFHYFSILRPLSELQIVEKFSKLEKYHPIFTSCNKAFKIDENKRIERWCCECDKCRFVFLIIAPYLSKEKIISYFGKNILDDKSQINGFRELLGLTNFKPFECVGEIEESVISFAKLLDSPDWKNDSILSELKNEFINKYDSKTILKYQEKVFAINKNHIIPNKFKGLVDDRL